jgi:hypothetical protein
VGDITPSLEAFVLQGVSLLLLDRRDRRENYCFVVFVLFCSKKGFDCDFWGKN